MKALRIIGVLLFFVLHYYPAHSRIVIPIKNQADFDAVSGNLYSALQTNDTDIYLKFWPGKFVFSENHINLIDVKASNKSIHFVGNGAVLIPSGRIYKGGDTYEGTFTFRNSWLSNGEDVDIWTSVQYADGLVEVIDEKKKQCRLKTSGRVINNDDYSNAFIMIPHWYQTSVYKVGRIEDDYIYFTVDDLSISYHNGYNINNDYNYGGKRIRYKLCNVDSNNKLSIIKGRVKLPYSVEQVWEGRSDNFLSIKNCSIRTIDIQDLSFWGNSFERFKSLIIVQGTSTEQFNIQRCSFIGIKSEVISVESTANITINDNVFRDCYSYGIYADNNSENVVISRNTFTRMGKRMQNSFCARCEGPKYIITGNTISDFGYGGIAAGIWYGADLKNTCSGVIENNHIFNTKLYNENIQECGIMDGGAIYLFTKNNGLIIRNNYIHDISGIEDNRGIFCDDGAYGYEIIGNVIKDIENSYCIDARRCPLSESKNNPQSSIKRANVNITIKDNVIGGIVRFEGYEEDSNGCEYGPNYFLLMKEDSIPQNTISSVEIKGDEVALVYTGEKKERIGLNKSSYRLLKNSMSWKHVKKYVIRKDN